VLTPFEFSVGAIADASGLTLLLPRTKGDEPMLVTTAGELPIAVFLGESHTFEGFECGTADRWTGLLVPDVQIEIEETSVFDPQREYAPYGALVRTADNLSLAARLQDEYRIYRQHLVPLVTGLATCRGELSTGFRQWRIILGEGENKRTLKEFSVEPAKGPPR
jgi:hypothetical protein